MTHCISHVSELAAEMDCLIDECIFSSPSGAGIGSGSIRGLEAFGRVFAIVASETSPVHPRCQCLYKQPQCIEIVACAITNLVSGLSRKGQRRA